MPEWGSSGSVRGDTSNGVPYRDRSLRPIKAAPVSPLAEFPHTERLRAHPRAGSSWPKGGAQLTLPRLERPHPDCIPLPNFRVYVRCRLR